MSNFDIMYQGTPLWDIGRPQQFLVDLASKNSIKDPILDVGCGTGENTLYLATLGYNVIGIDSAPTAIEKANRKAQNRGINANFKVFDVFKLDQLGKRFNTVIDSGLFHIFSDSERILFTNQLAKVIDSAGNYYFICFSEHEPAGWGPRRVTQSEIYSVFSATGVWRVRSIDAASFETNRPQGKVAAWFASILRL
ncbi:MAG: class I SAM-dependent methyltransferase [Candidatus Thorarchaeota archaeon]